MLLKAGQPDCQGSMGQYYSDLSPLANGQELMVTDSRGQAYYYKVCGVVDNQFCLAAPSRRVILRWLCVKRTRMLHPSTTIAAQLEWGVTLTFGFVVGAHSHAPKRKNRTPLVQAT